MIYLYIKTHNKTGLKYLGKTISADPHVYKGSGKLWRRHINKHGYDVTTEILAESNDKEVIKKLGLHYSNLWNVVDDITFANLVPESGEGGVTHEWSKESRQKLSNTLKGRKHSEETKRKYSKSQQKCAKHTSKRMKAYLSDPDNYQKRCEQLASNWNIPGHREKLSKIMSSLKWCNDGQRNYRKKEIPEGFLPGKLL
jgi:hypothetical protein